MEILKIENLAKNFYLHNAKKEIHSCQNINFTLEQGQFIGIVGLSGAGKSTILKCIHRTYLASTGKITYQSEAFGEVELTTAPERQILFLRKNEIGYVSQFLNVMPRTTAREHVMNALLERGVGAAEAEEKAEAMLRYFRLLHSDRQICFVSACKPRACIVQNAQKVINIMPCIKRKLSTFYPPFTRSVMLIKGPKPKSYPHFIYNRLYIRRFGQFFDNFFTSP